MCSLTISLWMALGSAAHAADVDGDQWTKPGSPGDCDDYDNTINPGQMEDGFDGIDHDCDGSISIRRDYVSAFETWAGVTAEWSPSHATVSGGELVLTPTLTEPGRVTLANTLAWSYGRPVVVITTTSAPTSGCNLIATGSNGGGSLVQSLSVGTQAISLASTLKAGGNLTLLRLDCGAGTGSATIDWLALQNSDYPFPPLNDIELTFDTMGTPYEGRTTFVRTSEDQSYVFVGSDVGGLGWSTDGLNWQTANGDVNDWYPLERYAAWDVWSTAHSGNAGDSFALTGRGADGLYGGLWYSDDIGAHWTPLLGHTAEDLYVPLGGTRTADDCESLIYTSGHLLAGDLHVDDWNTSWLYVASQRSDARGIWASKIVTASSASPMVCQPYDPESLPTAERFPDTEADGDAEGYDALPSALASGRFGLAEVVRDFVLVGYRPIAGADAVAAEGEDPSVLDALYLCPTRDGTSNCGVQSTCQPVVDTDDGDFLRGVRDIVRDPLHDNRFYIVDDAVEVTAANTCAPLEGEDSSVWVLDVALDEGFDYTFALWNTDDDVDDDPSWSVDSGSASVDYYGTNGTCPGSDSSDPTYGDLVPPKSDLDQEMSRLNGVEVDPAGDWLFTYYNVADSSGAYGCVRVFRSAIPGEWEEDEPLPWQPFQSWVGGEMAFDSSTRAAERREAIDAGNAFMKDEPLLDAWIGGVSDAIFVDDGDDGYNLLLGGNHVWWVPPEDGTPGWDTTDHQDLDAAPFILAFDAADGGPAFQDGQMRAVATFPGGSGTDPRRDLLVSANGDYKSFALYGGDPSSRPPATRPCNFQMTGIVGVDVAGWSDPDDSDTRQVWLLGNAPDGTSAYPIPYDRSLGRGIFLSRDGSDEYCWDGMGDFASGAAQLAGANFLKVGAGDAWWLYCEDQGQDLVDSSSTTVPAKPAWEACKTDEPENPFGIDAHYSLGDPVGLPRRISALGEGIAVMAASKACQSDLGVGCDEGDATGEGLWVVQDGGASGLSYTKVVLPTGSGCDEADLFGYTNLYGMAVHPSSGNTTGHLVDIFLASGEGACGLVEITFTLGSEDTSATLDVISTQPDSPGSGGDSYVDCTLSPTAMLGVDIAPDGQWLFVYGGPDHYDDASSGTDGGICAVDLTAGYLGGQGQVQAVTPDEARFAIHTVLPHPHMQGIAWFAGWADQGCLYCMAPGVYELQHRYKPATSSWAWASRRISGDDLGYKGAWELTWGGGDDVDIDAPYLMDLYVATTGSGFWDGLVEW